MSCARLRHERAVWSQVAGSSRLKLLGQDMGALPPFMYAHKSVEYNSFAPPAMLVETHYSGVA